LRPGCACKAGERALSLCRSKLMVTGPARGGHVSQEDPLPCLPPTAAELPDEVWINRALSVTSAVGAEPVNRGREDSLATKLNRNVSQNRWQAPRSLAELREEMSLTEPG